MKKCNSCCVVRDLSDFFRDKGMSDGRRGTCKACERDRHTRYRVAHREKAAARMREYYRKNKLQIALYRYKLTAEEYIRMQDTQLGLCLLCEKPPKGSRLCVDHCHMTGKVRGLLCRNCNRGLSLLENPQLLSRAMEYLQKDLPAGASSWHKLEVL